MGRTNPTFRDYLQRYESSWRPYRRTLRRRHREDFDHLFERACEHADAAGAMNAHEPAVTILVSMLLSQERELRHLREQVEGER
ncbi:MAG: hypothetical protein ACQETI_05620 [Halobacteriota archaeon]